MKKRQQKRITINVKKRATVKAPENARAGRTEVTPTVKRFYQRGHHPNSVRNLKPRRKGQPSLNPDGRRGQNDLRSQIFGPEWKAFVRDLEKAERLLDQVMRKDLGITLRRAYELF
jgi:hypothetical protein